MLNKKNDTVKQYQRRLEEMSREREEERAADAAHKVRWVCPLGCNKHRPALTERVPPRCWHSRRSGEAGERGVFGEPANDPQAAEGDAGSGWCS